MRRLHLLFLNIVIFSILPVQAKIPIVAYYGIPLEYSNASRFKEFKEAGFDVSICFYDDTPVDTLLRILDDAQESGIQLLISSGWISVQPHVGIPRLKNHPALYGYFLQDEPWPKDIQETIRRYRAMAKKKKKKPTYVKPSDCRLSPLISILLGILVFAKHGILVWRMFAMKAYVRVSLSGLLPFARPIVTTHSPQ